MRYRVNLATRVYPDHRLINRFTYGSLVLLTALAAFGGYRIFVSNEILSRLTDDVAVLQGKSGAKVAGVSEADVSRQRSRIIFYNAIIDRKNTNWLAVLDMFEQLTPEGISLSRLSPEKDGEFKLEGRARSFRAVRQYLEQLDSSKRFSEVLLLSHSNITDDGVLAGVQFSITCKAILQ